MSPQEASPFVQGRRVRMELRQRRTALQLTQKDVADALDWSTSKLIRIEKGDSGLSITDLKALLLHYGVTETAEIDRLVDMTRASKQAAWWQKYSRHFAPETLTFWELESSAIRIRQFQNMVVPGLLQNATYTAPMVNIGRDEESAAIAIEARMKRQDLIAPDGPELFFILDESVLYRVIGDSAVMSDQLRRVKELAGHPRVSIQIMPFTGGIHRGMQGPFEILELSDEPDDYAVIIEGPFHDRLVTDPSEQTREFVNIFFELEKLALPASETPAIIDARLRELAEQEAADK
jgi:transcriptional regulator with XRE-family HTH domain